MAAKYQIIYWRDFPTQIKGRDGRKRLGRPLTERFLQTVDAAAMKAGDTDTDVYLQQWRQSEWQQIDGDPDTFLDELAAQLESNYSGKRLSDLAKNGGWEPDWKREGNGGWPASQEGPTLSGQTPGGASAGPKN